MYSNGRLKSNFHPWIWKKEEVMCCSRVRKGKTNILWHKTMSTQDILIFDKSWVLFGNLFQKEKVMCCSIKRTRPPAVLTRILWHFPAERVRLIASMINRHLSCQRFYAQATLWLLYSTTSFLLLHTQPLRSHISLKLHQGLLGPRLPLLVWS